jgi:regulator of replication initiation timing
MKQLELKLDDIEEAVLALMVRINRLEHENENLRQENKELRWRLVEQD